MQYAAFMLACAPREYDLLLLSLPEKQAAAKW
jgi:hypothetical protein